MELDKKDGLVVALLLLVILLAMRPDIQEADDPDFITIEYQCSALENYKNVPPEVVTECRSRMIPATPAKNKV